MVATLLTGFHLIAHAGLNVVNLRCEYGANPLGIDESSPRLSWQLESSGRGERQTAYRVLVASSEDLLRQKTGDLWDSGKVDSDQSIQLPYAGKTLRARQRCFWKVQAWNKDGRPIDWSKPASWEMGLPAAGDWQDATWIRLGRDDRHSPLTEREIQTKPMSTPRKVEAFPAPLLRREFQIHGGFVRARAYVCGLGYNEFYVNGQRCGDAVLDPGQTTYDVRAFYVTHDITRFLRRGTNAVGIMLGNGFFGQNHAFNVNWLANGPPALIAKIMVDYADGSTQTITTDQSWRAATGPILYDNVYGGETFDARRDFSAWLQPGFDDSAWQCATKIESPTPQLTAQMIPPIRRQQLLPPQKIWPGESGAWLFDLGQNIAGWARIHIDAPAGTKLTLQFAEALTTNGLALDFDSTGINATGLKQTDIYVCRGGGETWEPRFTYHGFRYVSVVGLTKPPDKGFLTGVLVHSDVARAGRFVCSDETLNRIYETSLWTMRDNLHSVAEDCPHREKCGWLGDAHADAETEIFNFDMAQFWTKFVDDIETVLGRGGETYWHQKAAPGIPSNIAVGRRLCQEARPDWGAAYVLLPWYLYTYYGDTDVFARHYGHLKDWISYVKSLREDGMVTRGYGDWCPPGGNTNMECPVPLTSTAIFYGTVRIMEHFAGLLGKNSDANDFRTLADETKNTFNQKFFDKATHGYGSQTADAVALRFGLAPESQADLVGQSLVREVTERHDGHVFAGIHGGRPLLTQLCDHDADAVAIAAVKQTNWPSYAHALAQGATTWPEEFDELQNGKQPRDFSLNHPMQSGFAAWFHETIGGIRPAGPGFKRIELNPHGFNQLAWAEAEYNSPYGPIISRWHHAKGRFSWKISVPPNATATVFVPAEKVESVTEHGLRPETKTEIHFLKFEKNRAIYEVSPGAYEFKSDVTAH